MSLRKALKKIDPNTFVIDDVFKAVEKERRRLEKEREDEAYEERLELQSQIPYMKEILVGDYDYDNQYNRVMRDPETLIALHTRVKYVPGPIVLKYVL